MRLNTFNNMLKERNTIVIIITALLLCIILLFGLTKYILPSFEEQIMLNIIEQSKRVSNHLIIKYNKDQNFLHMEDMKNDLNLEKIKFFDKNGKILYSSSKKDIGAINNKDYFHNIVVKGQVYYIIVKKGKRTLENREVQVDVAEVYIPIMKEGIFQYAFEVYYNITDQVKRFESLKLKINLISYVIVLMAFLLVFFWQYYLYRNKIKEKQLLEKLYRSKKMSSMGEMIGNIAHQWRQPLSIISTGATGIIVSKEFGTITDEEIKKTCNVINENAQYLSDTIDDFRNFIKGERKEIKFNLVEDVNSFLHLLEGTIKKNEIHVVKDIEKDINIIGYPNELIQCFINIFNNSKDAFLNLEVDKYLFISSYIKDDSVIISFKDNAGGIPENIFPKIFEPYFTTKHQSQGTGLGLHMTYNLIVDGMNGSIEVSNVSYQYEGQEYTGAEFIISIPIN